MFWLVLGAWLPFLADGREAWFDDQGGTVVMLDATQTPLRTTGTFASFVDASTALSGGIGAYPYSREIRFTRDLLGKVGSGFLSRALLEYQTDLTTWVLSGLFVLLSVNGVVFGYWISNQRAVK